jgi:hypothetical protein
VNILLNIPFKTYEDIIKKKDHKENRPKVLFHRCFPPFWSPIHAKHTENSIDFLLTIHYNKRSFSKGEDMMKKILLALLAALMIFAFSACGSTDEQTGKDNNGDKKEDIASDSDLSADEEEKPNYSSDGDLVVEEERPASDSDLTEDGESAE